MLTTHLQRLVLIQRIKLRAIFNDCLFLEIRLTNINLLLLNIIRNNCDTVISNCSNKHETPLVNEPASKCMRATKALVSIHIVTGSPQPLVLDIEDLT